MKRTSRDPQRRLRAAVDRLPQHTREAMLRGIASNRIIVGAYVDPASGGICPMLAAHRNGGRTPRRAAPRAAGGRRGAGGSAGGGEASPAPRPPRRAPRREVAKLRSMLEDSL